MKNPGITYTISMDWKSIREKR